MKSSLRIMIATVAMAPVFLVLAGRWYWWR